MLFPWLQGKSDRISTGCRSDGLHLLTSRRELHFVLLSEPNMLEAFVDDSLPPVHQNMKIAACHTHQSKSHFRNVCHYCAKAKQSPIICSRSRLSVPAVPSNAASMLWCKDTCTSMWRSMQVMRSSSIIDPEHECCLNHRTRTWMLCFLWFNPQENQPCLFCVAFSEKKKKGVELFASDDPFHYEAVKLQSSELLLFLNPLEVELRKP